MSRRQNARQDRRARHYGALLAASCDDAERAAVEFDALRAHVRDLPEGDQAPAWARIESALSGLLTEFTCELHTPDSHSSEPQRTAARTYAQARSKHSTLTGSRV